jgi:hypothetical protein
MLSNKNLIIKIRQTSFLNNMNLIKWHLKIMRKLEKKRWHTSESHNIINKTRTHAGSGLELCARATY